MTVAWCHCADCRRWTGAPAPAFAAFEAVRVTGAPEVTHPSGVVRQNCPACGSPLAARFPYLPGQTYVPVGVLDRAEELTPGLHCHGASQLPWVRLDDDLPRHDASGRQMLNEAGDG